MSYQVQKDLLQLLQEVQQEKHSQLMQKKMVTFGDLFEGGPTELDRTITEDPSDDAARKLMNRVKVWK